jgi:anti-sigma factor RsiW
MSGAIHDFNAIGKTCLALGGVFVLLGLSGMFGHDASAVLQDLQAAGMTLPSWVPVSLFEHVRLLSALQLPPNALMAVVGWGLLRKQPWSLGGLKLTAWLFLFGTAAFGAWIVSAVGPAAASADPADQATRALFVWSMGIISAAMVASVAWFLWRLRGASIGPSVPAP